MALKTQRVRTATIASGASDSDAIDLSGVTEVVIVIPAAWTAAALTFRVSPDNVVAAAPVFDDGGNELTVLSANVVAGRAIVLTTLALQAMIAGATFLTIRSGTNAAPVNQAAARALTVILGG